MPRELLTYRDNLERLNEVFPDKDILTITEVVKFSGLDRRTVLKLVHFTSNYVVKANLARQFAAM